MIAMFFAVMTAASMTAAHGKPSSEPPKPKTFWQKLDIEEFVILTLFVGLPALALTASWLAIIYLIGILLQ